MNTIDLIELRNKLQSVYDDLSSHKRANEARDAGAPCIHACGLLAAAIGGIPADLPVDKWIPEGVTRTGNEICASVDYAKRACEELVNRAGRANEWGDSEFSNTLKDYVSELAPLVAKLLKAPSTLEEKGNG